MLDPAPAPTRVSFPRAAWAALGLVALLLVGGIFTQLAVVEDQRRINKEQRGLIERQVRETLPLIQDSRPLVRETLEGLPQTRRTARRLAGLAAEATPLVEDLDDAGLDSSVRAGRALAETLLGADVGATVRATRDLSVDLIGSDAGQTLNAVSVLVSQALDADLVGRSARAADLAPRLLRIQRRTFAIQQRALAIQERTLATATETLAVAREAEKHAESLDRKLGGSP